MIFAGPVVQRGYVEQVRSIFVLVHCLLFHAALLHRVNELWIDLTDVLNIDEADLDCRRRSRSPPPPI